MWIILGEGDNRWYLEPLHSVANGNATQPFVASFPRSLDLFPSVDAASIRASCGVVLHRSYPGSSSPVRCIRMCRKCTWGRLGPRECCHFRPCSCLTCCSGSADSGSRSILGIWDELCFARLFWSSLSSLFYVLEQGNNAFCRSYRNP